jgi:DedD protein
MSAPDPEASPPKSVANPEPKATAKPDAKAEGKPAANAAPGRGFVMQVGAFSSSDKARQLQQQLRAAGFPAYLESVKTTSGERTRVRAGPFATVEAAQKARSRLLGLKVAQGDLKVVPREN